MRAFFAGRFAIQRGTKADPSDLAEFGVLFAINEKVVEAKCVGTLQSSHTRRDRLRGGNKLRRPSVLIQEATFTQSSSYHWETPGF